jgi:hypothetical protein
MHRQVELIFTRISLENGSFEPKHVGEYIFKVI